MTCIENKGIEKKSSLLIICMITGFALGCLFPDIFSSVVFVGDIYISLLEITVFPIILLSVMRGVLNFVSEKRNGTKQFLIYWFLTAFSLSAIGTILSFIFRSNNSIDITGYAYSGNTDISFSKSVVSFFPNNIFLALISDNPMQIVVVAVLIGVAILKIENNKSKKMIITVVDLCGDLVDSFIKTIVKLSPVGIFFLASKIAINREVVLLSSLAKLINIIYIGYFTAIFIIYPLIVKIVIKEKYFHLLKRFSKPLIIALVTCSSATAFPLVVESLKYSENNSRTKTFEGIALVLKHANCLQTPIYCFYAMFAFDIEFTIEKCCLVFILSLITSLGTAGIPGGGIVQIAVCYSLIGAPLNFAAMIGAVYTIIDIPGTFINVLDDCIGTSISFKRFQKREIC